MSYPYQIRHEEVPTLPDWIGGLLFMALAFIALPMAMGLAEAAYQADRATHVVTVGVGHELP